MSMYDAIQLLSQGFQVTIHIYDKEEFEQAYGDTSDLYMYQVNDELWIKER